MFPVLTIILLGPPWCCCSSGLCIPGCVDVRQMFIVVLAGTVARRPPQAVAAEHQNAPEPAADDIRAVVIDLE
jgi:hypothetical protein